MTYAFEKHKDIEEVLLHGASFWHTDIQNWNKLVHSIERVVKDYEGQIAILENDQRVKQSEINELRANVEPLQKENEILETQNIYLNQELKELTHLKELSDDAYVTLQKESEKVITGLREDEAKELTWYKGAEQEWKRQFFAAEEKIKSIQSDNAILKEENERLLKANFHLLVDQTELTKEKNAEIDSLKKQLKDLEK